jgi:hypothetical protein
MDLQPGDVFAGHRIEGVAGRGGMGVVYRAVQLSLDRIVALKTIAPALAADPAFGARFVRESKAAAAVEHPNVIPIFSAGEEDGVLFIVMRYVDGPDLRSVVRAEGRLAPERAAAIVAQVAAALDAAHARGLVHRDVKPANVLTTKGGSTDHALGGAHHADHAYLTDFGLIKRTHSTATATRAGGWVGTLGYVAPEQIRDLRVDARTDVYALGCVLVHALTGAPPYERSSDEATMWAHLNDAPPDLPSSVPPAFGAVVRRALAKDPDDRFASAGELGRAVLAAVGRPAGSVAGLDRPAAVTADEETRITPPEARPDARGAGAAGGAGGAEAAPPGDLTGVTAAVTPGEGASAVAGPTRTEVAPAGGTPPPLPPRPRRFPVLAAGAAVLLGGLAAAAVALTSGGGDPRPDPAATATTPAASGPLRADGVRIGRRPNGVAIARGRAYVTVPRSERLARVDLDSFRRPQPGPRVGRGSLDVDAGFGALWVTGASADNRLTRIDLDTGRRTVTPLPDGVPVAVEVGEDAVWIGIRGARLRSFPRAKVVRIDPRTAAIAREIDIPRGVQDIAVGSGAVWVANRAAPSVTRVDVRTGELKTARTGRGPAALAIGDGAIWVANAEESTVSRINRTDPGDRATIGVAGSPRGVAFGGGSLWATSFASSTLTRIDGDTGRATGEPVEVALNPTKLTVSRGAVYVVSPAGGQLQRVRFAPGR